MSETGLERFDCEDGEAFEVEEGMLDGKKLRKREATLLTLANELAEAAEEEKAARAERERIAQKLRVVADAVHVKRIVLEGGVVSMVNGTNVSYSQKRIVEAMLENGVKAKIAEKVIEAAKKVTEYKTASWKRVE